MRRGWRDPTVLLWMFLTALQSGFLVWLAYTGEMIEGWAGVLAVVVVILLSAASVAVELWVFFGAFSLFRGSVSRRFLRGL